MHLRTRIYPLLWTQVLLSDPYEALRAAIDGRGAEARLVDSRHTKGARAGAVCIVTQDLSLHGHQDSLRYLVTVQQHQHRAIDLLM